jgi:hypothetical protein
VLVHAHRLLAQEAVRQHALEQCIATLHAASPEAYFFFTLDPPILTPAPYKRPGSAKARRLQPRFAAALLQSRTRQATLRLTTLCGLVQRGLPVAVWHFLALTPLPTTLAELAPPPSLPAA